MNQLNNMKKWMLFFLVLLSSCSNNENKYLKTEALPDAQVGRPYYYVISIPKKPTIGSSFLGAGYPYNSGLIWKPSYLPNTIRKYDYDKIIIEGIPNKVPDESDKIVFSFSWAVYGNGKDLFYKEYHIKVNE